MLGRYLCVQNDDNERQETSRLQLAGVTSGRAGASTLGNSMSLVSAVEAVSASEGVMSMSNVPSTSVSSVGLYPHQTVVSSGASPTHLSLDQGEPQGELARLVHDL